jgi:hypothetical protein
MIPMAAVFHARKLKELGFADEDIERMQVLKERLPNLQLLGGPENQAKQDTLPAQWIKDTYRHDDERKDYISTAQRRHVSHPYRVFEPGNAL